MKAWIRKGTAMAVTIVILAFAPCFSAEAAGKKTLTLRQAQQLALAGSGEYKRTLARIEMQQVKYAAAVKSVRLKKKNMSTFRWTPLLSFKFPQQPALADAYEWQYKPMQISSRIDVLTHQLSDVACAVKEEAALLYVQAYVCQEKIVYLKERLTVGRDTLHRNEIKCSTGDASSADVEKMKKTVERLTNELAAQERNLELLKEKISKLVKLDITAGYRFADPFVEADIPRSILDDLTAYTLEADHAYYEAKMTAAVNKIGLELNESLLRGQYGSQMNSIQPYINQAKSGQEVDSYAFRKAYNEFLTRIDQPWAGSLRILFIRIPKEWFKGAIDGVRYVEDDPYVLYTSALDYADALAEQEKAKAQLESSVRDAYENLITVRNAYQTMRASNQTLKTELDRACLRNRMGELSYEEFSDLQEEYAGYQLEELDLLAEYSSQLYSFDRLTCGGISRYLEEGGVLPEGNGGGDSFVTADRIEGAYYYIETKVEDNIFMFGVSIPDGFPLAVSGYELWVNGVRIGERTAPGSEIRHLALDLDSVDSVRVRLYDGEELAAVCEIDSQVNRAPLELYGNYRVEAEERETVASFSCQSDHRTGIVQITVTPEPGEPIGAYRIQEGDGRFLYSEELVPVTESFVYLSAMTADLGRLHILFYEKSGAFLYEGSFNTLTGKIDREKL